MSRLPPHALFDNAQQVRASGLSLNLICQQYPVHSWCRLVEKGGQLQFLFLDPAGGAIKRREQEEGYPPGHLSALTELNIQTLTKRVRDQLPTDVRDRVILAVYDDTIRLNLIIIDDSLCVMQPYLPAARGVDSPTFVLERAEIPGGLFATFEQVFSSLWERAEPI